MTMLDAQVDSETFKVKSFTDPSVTYQVYHSKRSGWRCDCKGYLFSKHCRHIEYVCTEYGFN